MNVGSLILAVAGTASAQAPRIHDGTGSTREDPVDMGDPRLLPGGRYGTASSGETEGAGEAVRYQPEGRRQVKAAHGGRGMCRQVQRPHIRRCRPFWRRWLLPFDGIGHSREKATDNRVASTNEGEPRHRQAYMADACAGDPYGIKSQHCRTAENRGFLCGFSMAAVPATATSRCTFGMPAPRRRRDASDVRVSGWIAHPPFQVLRRAVPVARRTGQGICVGRHS